MPSYRSLRQCVDDLKKAGQLVEIDAPIDPNLEAAEIQRRLFRVGGPAVLLRRVVGCRFPMLCNLFGTMARTRWLFRDSLDQLERLMTLEVDPADFMRRPRLYLNWRTPWSALLTRPRRVRSGPVLYGETTLDQLPQLRSWPDDGGAYVTLPQVYSEDPDAPGFEHANLGMYRVQISGGQYEPNREAGMHYQLHRGIAAHHAAALRRGTPLKVNVFVGGPPAMMVAAVMPLPEGMCELTLAGVLGRRRVPMVCREGQLPIHADADFCIVGYLDPTRLKPEGPFGDHLGYYSLAHEFPVLRVERVYHRRDAIWPFTVVGRPPQEDTVLGSFIHDLAGPIVPKHLPGVRAVHAVDAAGVHPLLLAIGAERYMPYDATRRPRELLTLANAILGYGQLSLAKYLWIAAGEDNPGLDVRDVAGFFRHMLERVDWQRDLHFQTCTTLDTLDYSSGRLCEGSKLVVAAAGPAVRRLPTTIDSRLTLPDAWGLRRPRVAMPGVLVVEGPAWRVSPRPLGVGPGVRAGDTEPKSTEFSSIDRQHPINEFPLVVLVDDSAFATASLENFLWTTFTRSDPASDVHGIESFCQSKHWGCAGSLVIDARAKPHHAPPLVEDPAITRRIDALATPGGPLHGIL